MDLFEELDQAPQDERIQTGPPTRRRMSRAQADAIERKQREQRWLIEDARANGVIVETAEELKCAAPCPTILGWEAEPDLVCAGCRLALGRAGIVLKDAG